MCATRPWVRRPPLTPTFSFLLHGLLKAFRAPLPSPMPVVWMETWVRQWLYVFRIAEGSWRPISFISSKHVAPYKPCQSICLARVTKDVLKDEQGSVQGPSSLMAASDGFYGCKVVLRRSCFAFHVLWRFGWMSEMPKADDINGLQACRRTQIFLQTSKAHRSHHEKSCHFVPFIGSQKPLVPGPHYF